ncbi:MAG: M55 family metallopeptidase [Clostridia bacterium]|nr:M55 family metallopeptidase [Clostridia bacterium]
MKLFISSDIEGTCGIAHWDETEKGKNDYPHFALQMSREVAAACEGALKGGAEDILVKDAHDYARNIDPELLPREVKIFRGWTRNPYSMMAGIDESYDGVIFTGYHSAAGMPGNPLSHTMNTKNNQVLINGTVASELMINSLTASMFNVPVRMVTGDEMLCEWIQSVNPNILTVPVNKGIGNASISIHPHVAIEHIRETAEKAMALDKHQCMFPLPRHFEVEVNYKEHFMAYRNSFYPGVKQLDSRRVRFETDNYMDVLTFFHFCL